MKGFVTGIGVVFMNQLKVAHVRRIVAIIAVLIGVSTSVMLLPSISSSVGSAHAQEASISEIATTTDQASDSVRITALEAASLQKISFSSNGGNPVPLQVSVYDDSGILVASDDVFFGPDGFSTYSADLSGMGVELQPGWYLEAETLSGEPLGPDYSDFSISGDKIAESAATTSTASEVSEDPTTTSPDSESAANAPEENATEENAVENSVESTPDMFRMMAPMQMIAGSAPTYPEVIGYQSEESWPLADRWQIPGDMTRVQNAWGDLEVSFTVDKAMRFDKIYIENPNYQFSEFVTWRLIRDGKQIDGKDINVGSATATTSFFYELPTDRYGNRGIQLQARDTITLIIRGVNGQPAPQDVTSYKQLEVLTPNETAPEGLRCLWLEENYPEVPRTGGLAEDYGVQRTLTESEIAAGSRSFVVVASGDRTRSTIWVQESGSTKFSEQLGQDTGWIMNALAYNPRDNYLYAISQPRISGGVEDPCYPAGHLLRIHPVTGQIDNLGKVTDGLTDAYGFAGSYTAAKGSGSNNDLWGGINSGVFDAQGRYWVSNSSTSGTRSLYQVDLNQITATRKTTAPRSATSTWHSSAEDLAIIPDSGNFAWGIQSAYESGTSVYIERINLDTGERARWDITNLQSPTGKKIDTAKNWGKAWTYGNGNLGFGTGSTGANTLSFQLKVSNPTSSNPTFELISFGEAPASFNTDAASNINVKAYPTEMQIDKVRIESPTAENGRVYWGLKITNNGQSRSSGFTLVDKVPTYYSQVNPEMTHEKSTLKDPYEIRTNGNTVSLVHGALEIGESVMLVISAMPPTTASGEVCVGNGATVIANEYDPNLENNSGYADPCVEKEAVTSNEENPNPAGPNIDGLYEATYTITVDNPSNGYPKKPATITDSFAIYQDDYIYGELLDSPQFAAGATPVKATWDLTDEFGKQSTGAAEGPGPYVLSPSTGRTITPLGTLGSVGTSTGKHIYEVTVTYRLDKDHIVVDEQTCTGAASHGLYNMASVDGVEDDSCLEIPEPREFSIRIVKEDLEKGEGAFLEGAEFKLFELNTGVQGDLIPLIPDPATAGNFVATLQEGTYRLVETKSPDGYNLLAKPVDFVIGTDPATQRVGIQLQDAANDGVVITTRADATSETIGIISVADIRKGELPKTGGMGVFPLIALGGFIALAGARALRRRTLYN